MELLLAGVVLLGVVAWLLIKIMAKPGVPKTVAARPEEPLRPTTPNRPVAAAAPAVLPEPVIPPELAGFERTEPKDLTDDQRSALLERLKHIPRPPRALQQLTSPAFLQKASSSEMAELVLSEPQVAAKVLATVNSPFYGLQKPVAHLGQGITFLGLNTVRSICMQYLLNQSFPTGSAALRPVFDHFWKASAISSELCARLSHKLGMPEGGVMVTQVVLSFLGPMAALTLLPEDRAATFKDVGLLDRSLLEQQVLGLSGSGLGQLLMTAWGLPESIVTQVSRVDRCLETPYTAVSADATATALSYWCARTGERLVQSTLSDWSTFDWQADDALDTALVRAYLQNALGDRLTLALQEPAVAQSMTNLLAAGHPPQAPVEA